MKRELFDAPFGPKPDPLAPEERAEVDRRIAEGKVTLCPPFASAEDHTAPRSVAEFREQLKRIGRRQIRGARAKKRREEALP